MSELNTFGVYKGQGKYYEEVIYSLALIYNIMNGEISTYLNQFDMSTGKFNILIAIKHHGGDEGISQVDVSKHLIVTPSNMTKLIDKLEKDGLVSRSPLKGDRRVNILKVSEKGTHLLDNIWDGYDQKLKELSGFLDEGKQKKLSGLLSEWFDSLRK